MNSHKDYLLQKYFRALLAMSVLLSASCASDPDPVNQEELITSVVIELTPLTPGIAPVTLKYYDVDGIGSMVPDISVSGFLSANKNYTSSVSFLNETKNPADDITAEIAEEANDHLVCYTVTGAEIDIQPTDSDRNGKPIGLRAFWNVGATSNGKIQITLRHQPGVKTGTCPGNGETDVQVEFDIAVR